MNAERPRRRGVQLVILLLGITTLCVQAFGTFGMWKQVNRPFPGFIVSRELVVMQLNQPYWNGIRAGLRPGDLVWEIDGRPLSSATDLIHVVESRPAGERFRYTVSRGERRFEVAIASSVFRLGDFLSTFGVLSVTGLGFLLLGSLVAWARCDAVGGGVYGLSFAVAFAMSISTDLSWTREFFLSKAWRAILIAGLLHFALVFPEPINIVRRRRWVVALPYVAVFPLAAANFLLSNRVSSAAARVEGWNRWLTFGAAVALLGSMALALRRPIDADGAAARLARDRARIASWGMGLAVACYGGGFLGAEFGLIPNAPASVFVLPAWIWFGSVALASVRDDIFELGARRRETLVRSGVFVMTVALYLLLLAGAWVIVRRAAPSAGWLLAPAFLLFAVLVAEPLRRTARAAVSWAVNSPVLLPAKVLRDLTEEVASSLDQASIVSSVARMSDRLRVARTALFLEKGSEWVGSDGTMRLPSNHPLVASLRETSAMLARSEVAPECRVAMETLGLTLAFPLRFRGDCLGFFGVETASPDGAITRDDRHGFTALAGQIAVALENARVFQRIRQLEEEVRAENVVLKEMLANAPGIEGLVGQSPAIRRVYQWIEQAAPTGVTVCLRGETGTGKELVARAIHARSSRRDRPMIRVNCAAIHPSLLESEFFGHERGAFTGAVTRKVGRFELASGGTLFLDEIADLPLELQPKLLRVLQEKEFERVGGTTILRSDVRVIAATNRDLDLLVRRGRFREDLFFRLNVFPIVVPPLRERREDIPALVAHLIHRFAAKTQRRITSIEERSLRSLVSYSWPGNVRELENVIERAIVLSDGECLVVRELELSESETPAGASVRPLSQILHDVKVHTIRRALAETSGNQAQAASLLHMKPSSLSRMMKSLGLRG